MSVEHKSLLAEILFTLGRASTPLSSSELYERCDLSDKPEQISKALYELAQHGKIVRAAGEGRARYTLPAGVTAPAPARKVGRSKAVQKDDAAAVPITGVRPAVAASRTALDMGDHGYDIYAAGKTQRAKPIKPKADHLAAAGKVIESSAEDLADAILAKTRAQLSRLLPEAESIEGNAGPIHIHIHIEQVDFHLGGL